MRPGPEQSKFRYIAFACDESVEVPLRDELIREAGSRAYRYDNGVYIAPWRRAQRAIPRLLNRYIPFTIATTNHRDPQAVLQLTQKPVWRSPNFSGSF